jgi:hypothetical protein
LNAGIVDFCPIKLRTEAGFNRSVAIDVLGPSSSFKLLPIPGLIWLIDDLLRSIISASRS